jgi:large exoprotein involved in heme utilization and adhesion
VGGKSGSIAISASSLRISNGGQISSSTLGSGDGGSVSIAANSIVLDGSGATLPTGIAATTSYERGGKGGDILIAAGALQVLGGAEISAATQGSGAGGTISVTGGSALVSGAGSAINAQTLAPEGGSGGDIRFNVNSVAVLDGGQISASTQGSGRGGTIEITAGQVTVDGGSSSIQAGTSGLSGIVTTNPFLQGITLTLDISYTPNSDLFANLINPVGNVIPLFNAGDATGANFANTTFSDTGATAITGGVAPYSGTLLPATPLGLLNGGTANGNWQLQITNVNNSKLGNSGLLNGWSLTVNGKQFTSADTPQSITPNNTTASTVTVTLPTIQTAVQAGAGGNIQINAGTVVVSDGGTIQASTYGSGKGGDVAIQGGSFSVNGNGTTAFTGVRAASEPGATGAAGSLNINAGKITLSNGAQVSVMASNTSGGDITVASGSSITLTNGSSITASAAGNGGSISIAAQDMLYLYYSSIVATAGTQLSLGGTGGGGGNISVDPTFIVIDHGTISANAAVGAGGNILLQGSYFLSSETSITATGSTAGTVQILSPSLDLANGLIGLSGAVLDDSSQLREQCARRLGQDFSSFLLLGRDGVETSPDDALEAPVPRNDGRGKQEAKRKTQKRILQPPLKSRRAEDAVRDGYDFSEPCGGVLQEPQKGNQ